MHFDAIHHQLLYQNRGGVAVALIARNYVGVRRVFSEVLDNVMARAVPVIE